MEPKRNKQAQIEHVGCWFVFCALMVAIIMQAGQGMAFAQFAGEWSIFIVLSVGMMIGYIRCGVWKNHEKADIKARLAVSMIGGLAVIAFVFGMIWRNVDADKEMLGFAFLFALIAGIIVTALCFGILTLAARSENKEEKPEVQAQPQENDEQTTKQ